MQQFYIGTYTQDVLFGTGEIMHGKGEGIYMATCDIDNKSISTSKVADGVDNPSFVAVGANGTKLYCVNELKSYKGEFGGSVSAFSVDADGTLRFLNAQPTRGSDPCHLSVAPTNKILVVANFMSGSVAVYPLLEDGAIGEMLQFIQHEGNSVDPKRQAGPHAHAAVFDPSGEFVLVPDLGCDCVFVYHIEKDGMLQEASRFLVAPGFGPRSLEFHPTLPLCYLINELGSSISLLSFDNSGGVLTHVQTASTLPEGYEGNNICADLHVTADGRFLYGSNRGHDSIVTFALDGKGHMQQVEIIPCGGKTPRNFSLVQGGKAVLVANQDSDNLVLFVADPVAGRLKEQVKHYAPTPVCVQPIP